MALSNRECAHRWAHAKFGNNNEVNGSNCHGGNVSFYSYNTVIAQALDREKNLFLVIDVSLTPSTSKHIGYVNIALPAKWNIIHTHFPGAYYRNVRFIGSASEWNAEKRMELVDHLIGRIYEEYFAVIEETSLETEIIRKEKWLGYIDMLNGLYKNDCTLKKWLKYIDTGYTYGKKKYIMVKGILANKSDKEITDAMFGNGTWNRMQQRIAPLKKARHTREVARSIVAHVCCCTNVNLTINDIRKMSAKEIVGIRFKCIEYKRKRIENFNKFGSYEMDAPRKASYMNALKFLGFVEDKNKYLGFDINKIICNGRIIYDQMKYVGLIDGVYFYSHGKHWDNPDIEFGYDGTMYRSFCNSADKFVWRKRFWDLARLKMRRIYGNYLNDLVEHYNKMNKPLQLSEEQTHIYNEFIVRKNRYEADVERRKKIEAARKRKEIEEKMKRIALYKEMGVEGVRKTWYERLESVPSDVLYSPDVCYGGNILLRFTVNGREIETSKGIRLTFEQCHKYWEIIKKWHDTGTFNNGVEMAGYRVNSFKDDILTAGCHDIAYCEMERMYKEMCEVEAA